MGLPLFIVVISLLSHSSTQPLYSNLVTDPTFTSSTVWGLFQNGGASASYTLNVPGVRIQTTNGGTMTWHVQLYQNTATFRINATRNYVLGVEARASAARQITVDVDSGSPNYSSMNSDGPWVILLTNQYQNYSTCFQSIGTTDTTSRITVSTGAGQTNPTADTFVRFIYVIPVPSCSTTTNRLTTSRLTTGSVTTRSVTSSAVTTSPVTTNQVTSSPVTTSPLTSNEMTTQSVTSNFLTTQEIANIQSQTSSSLVESGSILYYIIGGSVGGLIVVVIIAVATILLIRRRGTKEEAEIGSMIPMANHGSSSRDMEVSSIQGTIRVHENSEIPFEELKFYEQIGIGAFGIVYKGEWRHQYVAIKRMKNGLITVSELKIFREECEVMLGLRSHKNILQLLGVCCSDIEKLCLVTEFCANGSLDKYIHSHPPLKKKIVFNLIKGIAVGMTHLTKEGVVHRDLSARNVLLNDVLTPKISDFGLARIVYDESSQRTTNSSIGPIKWMAPESLEKRVYSQKSDVWMFGCTCHEIIFGSAPFSGSSAVEAAMQVAKMQLKPSVASKSDWGVISDIMTRCFEFDPSKRPTFEVVCDLLDTANEEQFDGTAAKPGYEEPKPPIQLYGSVAPDDPTLYNNKDENHSSQVFYRS